ncbi:MAG: prephenate dehydrogenase [Anaerolineales bacterium]|nr:prephenate dehydrogenase [Anaerolineales bacterium]
MEDGFSLQDATVAIVGLGLMGGSLAMSLKGKCARLIGFDPHLPTVRLARAASTVDHAESFFALSEATTKPIDVLVLAAPVPTILGLLHQLRQVNYQLPLTLLDLGSTKRDILQAMSSLPENFDPIGGHPICGKEKLGLENASASLYQDAPFILTPLTRTTQRAISAACQIISAIGAHPLEMTAEQHDEILSATSHLPFLLSSALAHSTPRAFAPFIGPGFRSTSRLAGSPAHMMLGILQSNRDNILRAIRSFHCALNEIESALRDENYLALENLLQRARSEYHLLIDGETIPKFQSPIL